LIGLGEQHFSKLDGAIVLRPHPKVSPKSEDCLQFLALLAKLGAQAAGAFERFAGLPRGISVRCDEANVNGLYALRDLNVELAARGTTLILAGRRTEFLIWLREIGLYRTELDNRLFPTLSQALKAYRRETIRAELPPSQPR